MSSVSSDKFVFSLPVSVISSSETVELRVYEGTDYSGGTVVDTWNPNRCCGDDTKQSVITTGSTGTSKGDLLITRHAFSDKKSSGKTEPYSFIILDKSKKYLIELENEGTSATDVDYSALIFES